MKTYFIISKQNNLSLNGWGQRLTFMLLVTLYSSGVLAQGKLWDKTFGGSNYDNLTALQQTSDGGYILGGYSNSYISGDKTEDSKGEEDYSHDYWVVKLNAAGQKEWDKTLGGRGDDRMTSLQQTNDGGYILEGYSYTDIGGDKTEDSEGGDDYWLVKLNAAGKKVWDKTIGGEEDEWLASLQSTRDGGYILGGTSSSGISGDKTEASRGDDSSDYWIVKLNADGTKAWDKTIGGNSNDFLNSLQQTNNGDYILGGYSESGKSGDKSEDSKGFYDYWVVKIEESGKQEQIFPIYPFGSANFYP